MYWNFSELLIAPGEKGEKSEKIFSAADGPLIVEVGFGNGEFLAHLASKRRDATVVGFEVSQWCAAKAARRALAAGLDNVRIVWGDARFLLSRTFEAGAVDEVYMNFPCPWPKRRHADRRVTSDRFAETLRVCLKLGGRFVLATDVDWYAEETAAVFAAFAENGAFETSGVTKNPAREYLTKYERKWREMGRDTYLVEVKAVDGGMIVEETGVVHEEDLDEIQAACSCTWDEVGALLSSLRGDEIEGPGYRVVFGEAFLSGNDAALVLAISVDEGFEQHYYIKLVRSGGVLRGKADAVGHPYRTPGVRASLRHVMRKTGARF